MNNCIQLINETNVDEVWNLIGYRSPMSPPTEEDLAKFQSRMIAGFIRVAYREGPTSNYFKALLNQCDYALKQKKINNYVAGQRELQNPKNVVIDKIFYTHCGEPIKRGERIYWLHSDGSSEAGFLDSMKMDWDTKYNVPCVRLSVIDSNDDLTHLNNAALHNVKGKQYKKYQDLHLQISFPVKKTSTEKINETDTKKIKSKIFYDLSESKMTRRVGTIFDLKEVVEDVKGDDYHCLILITDKGLLLCKACGHPKSGNPVLVQGDWKPIVESIKNSSWPFVLGDYSEIDFPYCALFEAVPYLVDITKPGYDPKNPLDWRYLLEPFSENGKVNWPTFAPENKSEPEILEAEVVVSKPAKPSIVRKIC